MKNSEIKEILNIKDVSDFLSLWDTFCDWAKERRLDANIETFFSYLIWLKKQL